MRWLSILITGVLAAGAQGQTFPLVSAKGLTLHNVTAGDAMYRGRRAVRLVETEGAEGHAIALIDGSGLKDGTIEADMVGVPRPGAPEGSRGFVGIAFRVRDNGSKFECFYLRPTNARAGDQLRRNHSTQYVSHPDWPWFRLRRSIPASTSRMRTWKRVRGRA
jgi:hypothetical protein